MEVVSSRNSQKEEAKFVEKQKIDSAQGISMLNWKRVLFVTVFEHYMTTLYIPL